MKCKFCGSENTKEMTVTYVGDLKGINRHALAECKDCSRIFGYISKTDFPKIISTQYSQVPNADFSMPKEIEVSVDVK